MYNSFNPSIFVKFNSCKPNPLIQISPSNELSIYPKLLLEMSIVPEILPMSTRPIGSVLLLMEKDWAPETYISFNDWLLKDKTKLRSEERRVGKECRYEMA